MKWILNGLLGIWLTICLIIYITAEEMEILILIPVAAIGVYVFPVLYLVYFWNKARREKNKRITWHVWAIIGWLSIPLFHTVFEKIEETRYQQRLENTQPTEVIVNDVVMDGYNHGEFDSTKDMNYDENAKKLHIHIRITKDSLNQRYNIIKQELDGQRREEQEEFIEMGMEEYLNFALRVPALIWQKAQHHETTNLIISYNDEEIYRRKLDKFESDPVDFLDVKNVNDSYYLYYNKGQSRIQLNIKDQ